MYSACLFCNSHLGANEVIEQFPVGRRLAFDAHKGRLWVVCPHCGRWNLTPIEERWEAVEECERRFRETHLHVSTDNIGLAQLPEGLDLVRIGKALRPEIAAWRYGPYLRRWLAAGRRTSVGRALFNGLAVVRDGVDAATRLVPALGPSYDALTWLRIHSLSRRVIDVARGDGGEPIVIRFGHLEGAELLRPDREQPWRLAVRHDAGCTLVSGDSGLRTAGKLLAALNGFGGRADDIRYAVSKLEDAANPNGYFARLASIAMRTSWGRFPEATESYAVVPRGASIAERLALYLTNRSFWGRGGIGSEPATPLPLLPLVDRLALEMAANEDAERRAMMGELAELERAWREAEEIAAIADGLLSERAEWAFSVRGLFAPA